MFLTKKHISRRTVLRGAGAMLSLPLLDAMVPAATVLAQTAASPKPRFVGLFVPHGMAPGYWVPDKEGTGFTFPFNFKPLEAYRDHVTILPAACVLWFMLRDVSAARNGGSGVCESSSNLADSMLANRRSTSDCRYDPTEVWSRNAILLMTLTVVTVASGSVATV